MTDQNRNLRLLHIDKTNPKLLGLTVVEINPTELCNRTCSFCPRADPIAYPNLNLNMSVDTALLLSTQLQQSGFTGEIHITGRGEPLLNPNILEIIQALSCNFPVELITNGDRLISGQVTVSELKQHGLGYLVVNCYDGNDQIKIVEKMLSTCQIDYTIRDHYDSGKKSLIKSYNFNNRGGLIESAESIARPCWLPMYKAFVDWDGNIELCCNDWAKKQSSFGNIHHDSFSDIWMNDEFTNIRHLLLEGHRHLISSCKNCDINGIQQGHSSADVWSNNLLKKA